MVEIIQAIRGMNDILPSVSPRWQCLESVLSRLVAQYGYQEIRLPVLEKDELFQRSIGEVTDIVEKEMYTFLDRNHQRISLRPEGTAGCVRAAIEHGLLYNQVQRLWYMGPMFRHERPQKGRFRQFQQFGVEAFGMAGPDIEAELICMSARLWHELGLEDSLALQINSLGSKAVREAYREQLVDYFKQHNRVLDEDSQRRLKTNPLRILDSKNPEMQSLINNAPQLRHSLDEESQEHFNALQEFLQAASIVFTISPRLVRGLDYYNQTVFEWVSVQGHTAQNTVCAGGRYDGLVVQLGGSAVPAVGLAIGLERLLDLLAEQAGPEPRLAVYFIMLGLEARKQGLVLAEQLRTAWPSLTVLVDCGSGGFKNQFKRADKSGALLALVLGEEEAKLGTITIKHLRESNAQTQVVQTELIDKLGLWISLGCSSHATA